MEKQSNRPFNLLEINATDEDKREGYDLADYLIKFDYKQFIESNQIESNHKSNGRELVTLPIYEEVKPIIKQSVDWADKIDELEQYFQSIILPDYPIKLNQAATITNVSNFIDSHLATVKTNNGNRTFLPYLNRLFELKKLLNIN